LVAAPLGGGDVTEAALAVPVLAGEETGLFACCFFFPIASRLCGASVDFAFSL
jgi:hypothetical protein